MTNKFSKILVPIGLVALYVIIAIIVYVISDRCLPPNLNNIVNIISILSAYSSLFALVIMLFQVMSIKQVSEQTKEKMNVVMSVSDCTKYADLLRSIQNDISTNKYELALHKLYQVKDFLVYFKTRCPSISEDKQFMDHLKKIGYHINSISTGRECDLPNTLNTKKLIKDFEQMSVFMTEKSSEYITKI